VVVYAQGRWREARHYDGVAQSAASRLRSANLSVMVNHREHTRNEPAVRDAVAGLDNERLGFAVTARLVWHLVAASHKVADIAYLETRPDVPVTLVRRIA
jgi:hypothetical protein